MKRRKMLVVLIAAGILFTIAGVRSSGKTLHQLSHMEGIVYAEGTINYFELQEQSIVGYKMDRRFFSLSQEDAIDCWEKLNTIVFRRRFAPLPNNATYKTTASTGYDWEIKFVDENGRDFSVRYYQGQWQYTINGKTVQITPDSAEKLTEYERELVDYLWCRATPYHVIG